MSNVIQKNYTRDLSGCFTLHVPNVLNDIIPNAAAERKAEIQICLNTLQGFLVKIADRAAELNDDKLLAICCRMTLFECADPSSPEYNPEGLKELYKKVGYNPMGLEDE